MGILGRTHTVCLSDRASRAFGVGRDELRTATHEAAIVARLDPVAEIITETQKVATKSESAQAALVARLDGLIDHVGKRDDLDHPDGVRRVLRELRRSIKAREPDPERDGHGRKVDPINDDRDGYGRRRR